MIPAINPKELFEALLDMQTTEEIASAFDKVVEEVGSVTGSIEIVAAVLVASIWAEKISITMEKH